MRLVTTAFATILFAASMAGAQGLVVTEIMYNSQESGTDIEYIEILNASSSTIDLSGHYVLDDSDDHGVVPLAGTLGPCFVLVVASNNDAFVAKYGGGALLNPSDMDSGPWGLNNTGDIVRLFAQVGSAPDPLTDTIVDIVAYDDADPWPTEPDGDGPALDLIDPWYDNNLAGSWTITIVDGTPGLYLNCEPIAVESSSWGEVKALYR